MFKKITIMLILALLVTTAWARDYGQTYHEIQVVDELGRPVTDITNLYIYAPGTTTDAVIYSDRNRQNLITIPMTEASLNTTLVDGLCSWYGPDGYDFSVTNDSGVGPEGNYGHLPRTGSEGTIVFPSFLHAISTAAYLDGESITMGDGFDWVINGGGVADTLSFTPASDDADFIVGSVDPAESASMFVYISATEGWFIDSSVPSASWTGGTLNCNVSSNYATNINTGTSTGIIHIGDGTGTGAINIGNSAGGIITLDTDESISITADTTFAVTNTTGDQTYTTASSFNIVATENAAMTIYTHANGGAATDIHTYNQTGTAASAATQYDAAIQLKALVGGIGLYSALNDVDAIRIESNGGTAATINIHNNQGTVHTAGAASIQLLSDDGAIGLTATTETAAGAGASAIQLTAAAGAIELSSGLDATGAVKLTANGGTSSDIDIWNDTGDTADSIHLLTDLGGITATSTAGAVALSGIGGHTITSTAVADTAYGVNIGSAIATHTRSEGSAAYLHTTLTGNIDGPTYNLGSWLDITAGTPTAGVLAAIDCGIYETGADMSGVTWLVAAQMQLQLDDTNNAATVAMMRFNCNATGGHNTPDYWFVAANSEAIAYTANVAHTAASTDKVGAIKIYFPAVGAAYIYVYDHAGQ